MIFERTDKNDLIERQVRTYFCTPLLDMLHGFIMHYMQVSLLIFHQGRGMQRAGHSGYDMPQLVSFT